MKKLISAILVLALMFCLVSAFTVESSAVGDMLMIHATDEEIVIDGELDDGYTIVSYSYAAKDENWVQNDKLWDTIDANTDFYACWDKTNLYLFIKVPCNEEHSSYMDNGAEHYIFNGHHVMWALLPDNPYQDKYKGDQEDGTWTWSALFSKSFMYEWTTICDSRDGKTVTTDHFKGLTTTAGFAACCKSEDGYDTYEVQIPMAKVTTTYNPKGIIAEEGSMFGIGFRIGLIDHGTGYGDDTDEKYCQDVKYSDYFTGDKYPYGLAYAKLVGTVEGGDESEDEGVKVIDRTYEVFPSLSGSWVKTDHDGASCNVSYSGGVATINGSTAGTWPSAKATLSTPIFIDPETTYLVYDISFTSGNCSLRFNSDEEVNTLISPFNYEAGSNDLLPGEYKGYVSFKDIAEKYPTHVTEDGYYVIDDMTVFTVNGADVTIKQFDIIPDYEIPSEESEAESEVESEAESEAEESKEESKAEESKAESETESAAEESKEESKADTQPAGFPVWLIIVIAVVAVAIIVVVIVIVAKKKK